MKKRSLQTLFTLALFFNGLGIIAQTDYVDTVSFGGKSQGYPIDEYDFVAPTDSTLEPFPITEIFAFTPDPSLESTTNNVTVDVTIKYEAYKYDQGTDEIFWDSIMYANEYGSPTDQFGASPVEDGNSIPGVGNGDIRQFNNDEVMLMIFESVNNLPPSELYPDVQMSVWGVDGWTNKATTDLSAAKGADIYLNGEYVGLFINNSGEKVFRSKIYTDLESMQEVNIALEAGDTLMIKGNSNLGGGTYHRFGGLQMKFEDIEPATSVALSAEGGTAEITDNGGSVRILGDVQPATASDKRIKWSLDNNDIGATINQATGVVSAWPRDAGNGTVTVVGTVGSGDATVSGTIEVTISGQEDILVDSIFVNTFNDTIADNGGTRRISAEVYPDLAANKDVVWSIDDAGTGATIDSTGLVRAYPSDSGNGTVIVKATAADGSGVSDTMKIVIVNQQTIFVEGIDITYTGEFAEIIEDGDSLQLTAIITPEIVTDKSLTWSIEGADLGATIDENGLLIASGEDDGNGVITVKATANDGSGVSATVSVIISGQASDVSAITKHSLSDAIQVYPTVVRNQILNIKVLGENNFIQTVKVINITGATVDTHNYNGQLTTQTSISMNDLSGIFFIEINTKEGTVLKKVLGVK